MTISVGDGNILRRNHFTDAEIQDLANAVTPDGKSQPPVDINSPLWRAVISSRKSWYMGRIRKGWKRARIESTINNFYGRGSKRSIYDFLKAEYQPKKIIDYMSAIKRRARNRAAKLGYKKYSN